MLLMAGDLATLGLPGPGPPPPPPPLLMPLEAGEYMLCLGCTGYKDGDFTVFHRLYDVCNLTVITDKKAVGYFDMFSKVSVK